MFINSSLCKRSFSEIAAEIVLKDAVSTAEKLAAHNLIDDSAAQIKGGVPTLSLKVTFQERVNKMEALFPEIIHKAKDYMIKLLSTPK